MFDYKLVTDFKLIQGDEHAFINDLMTDKSTQGLSLKHANVVKWLCERGIEMKTVNIKSDMPDRLEAGRRLSAIISENRQKEKVIKIVHGYGSTGVGGAIKHAVRKSLRNRKKKGEIKAFIPGEAFHQLMGFDEVISTYRHLLRSDSDYNKMNEGITYVIL